MPKCHFCKQPIGESVHTKGPPGKRFYICGDCHEVLRAVIHDVAGGVFSDISQILNSPGETWVEQLESYSYTDLELKKRRRKNE